MTPAKGSIGALPTDPVTVTVVMGDLDSVSVTDPGGTKVPGSIDGARWRSTEGARLKPSTTYTVRVRATGTDGTPAAFTGSFTTRTPKVTATYSLPYGDSTVGTGMPATVQFDSSVETPAMRREIEKRVRITTTPRTEGSWGWLDDRQLMWRPKTYWQPGTKVTVRTPFTGFQTGKDKWVANDDGGTMTIGRSMTSLVDMNKHVMTVKRDGAVVRRIPVSTGRPGPETETRSGVKVVMSKEPTVTMDSATVGIEKGEPGYYKLDTRWNMRVTWTGEYLHSAPWSVGSQGSSNVSHGCVNMAPENAKWMFDNSMIGDVVDFTGSSRVFQPTEGIGVWQYSWAEWQKRSALR